MNSNQKAHAIKYQKSRDRIRKTKQIAKSRQRQCGHSCVNRYVLNYATLMELERDYNMSMIKQSF